MVLVLVLLDLLADQAAVVVALVEATALAVQELLVQFKVLTAALEQVLTMLFPGAAAVVVLEKLVTLMAQGKVETE